MKPLHKIRVNTTNGPHITYAQEGESLVLTSESNPPKRTEEGIEMGVGVASLDSIQLHVHSPGQLAIGMVNSGQVMDANWKPLQPYTNGTTPVRNARQGLYTTTGELVKIAARPVPTSVSLGPSTKPWTADEFEQAHGEVVAVIMPNYDRQLKGSVRIRTTVADAEFTGLQLHSHDIPPLEDLILRARDRQRNPEKTFWYGPPITQTPEELTTQLNMLCAYAKRNL